MTISMTMTMTRALAELGERVDRDGPAPHSRLLRQMAGLLSDVAPGAAAVLADSNSPAVVRQRALAVGSAVLLRQPAGSRGAFGLAA